jgi:hypothetical protein
MSTPLLICERRIGCIRHKQKVAIWFPVGLTFDAASQHQSGQTSFSEPIMHAFLHFCRLLPRVVTIANRGIRILQNSIIATRNVLFSNLRHISSDALYGPRL